MSVRAVDAPWSILCGGSGLSSPLDAAGFRDREVHRNVDTSSRNFASSTDDGVFEDICREFIDAINSTPNESDVQAPSQSACDFYQLYLNDSDEELIAALDDDVYAAEWV